MDVRKVHMREFHCIASACVDSEFEGCESQPGGYMACENDREYWEVGGCIFSLGSNC